MGSSLHVGLEALLADDTPQAVVIMLCDQPLLTPQTLNALIDAFQERRSTLVASEYAGIMGVPALFSFALFPELLALRGENGARSVIQRHITEVHLIPFPNGALDIDTPEDCLRLRVEGY